jgi:hypothetical protein
MKDWVVRSNTGNNVSDLCLDYLNQAQDELRFEAFWSELIKTSTLAVTDKVASLPSDLGEICCVYHADNNGKPTQFFYNRSIFSSDGYYEVNNGDKDNGYTRSIQFYMSPSSDVTLRYYRTLEDFENSGTEYSWFPAGMLMTKAQLMYLKDEGLSSTSEYSIILNSLERSMVNFKRGHQHVNVDIRTVLRDNLGHVITFGAYNLADGEDDKLWDEAYGNSTDIKGYSYHVL